jgi:hypothetical protein
LCYLLSTKTKVPQKFARVFKVPPKARRKRWRRRRRWNIGEEDK